jgi:hypothetical protein
MYYPIKQISLRWGEAGSGLERLKAVGRPVSWLFQRGAPFLPSGRNG